MAPRLIGMLTHNDQTVTNAIEVFNQCAQVPADFWGFKDVGLPVDRMKQLVKIMKDKGKTTFLEIVSLSEQECLDGAELALECGFDYLTGALFFPSVFKLLKAEAIKFFPFCGKVGGHPIILEGSVSETVSDIARLKQEGVDGVDLCAYRFSGDPEELARQCIQNTKLPVILAGSIYSFDRLDVVKKLDPWAFTIGSAFFDGKFLKGGSFPQQVQAVVDYLRD